MSSSIRLPLAREIPKALSSWISFGCVRRRITGRVHGTAVYHQLPRCSCGSPYNSAATPSEPPFHRVNTSPRRRAAAACMRLTRKRSRSDSGSDTKKTLGPKFRDAPCNNPCISTGRKRHRVMYSGTTTEISGT
ncbi:hypothetical protein ALC57_05862 [Trachymyrmex cornetzi]|uniref:Uncharacterized protein n=1 Tax=Trachymyrmex cornetzi TaxID=471704 RepID=A0A151J9S2_9HYME|nr:hypothetical protein ALC57_05862 [Trachymyrmex cornetzi]